MKHRFIPGPLATGLLILATLHSGPASLRADTLESIGVPPRNAAMQQNVNSPWTWTHNLEASSDGATLVGQHAGWPFKWQDGTYDYLADASGSVKISGDGGTIIHYNSQSLSTVLVRNGTAIRTLPLTDGVWWDLSHDGETLVGDRFGENPTVPNSNWNPFREVNGSRQYLPVIDDDEWAAPTLDRLYCSGDASVLAGNDGTFGGSAYRWIDGSVEFLDKPAHDRDGNWVNAISEDGRVIVGARVKAIGGGLNPPISPREVVRWVDGQMEILPRPAGSQWAEPFGVSADGSKIVGTFLNVDGFNEAFMWTAETGMVSLLGYLGSEYGVDTTGWWLNTARTISPDGKTIFGIGWDPDDNNILWRFRDGAPLTLELVPSKRIFKLGEEFVAEVRVRHTVAGTATYRFTEEVVKEGGESPVLTLRQPNLEEDFEFTLDAEENEIVFSVPAEASARGPATLTTQVARTNEAGETTLLDAEVSLMVSPLEATVTVTPQEFLLNQTPESKWGSRAVAINDFRRANIGPGLQPYGNLLEIELKLENLSNDPVEGINIPGAAEVLSLIASTDAQNPGVPLDPVRFYSHDGSVIDLTDPNADRSIEDLILAPGEKGTFAWVLNAYDANPNPEIDDSVDLEFKALVLGSLGGKTVRELGTEEFHVIDRPLLEWGIRPKEGRTVYQSAQVVRVEGYIENISTRDDRPPQDIRVMVYQLPEGNLGGGFMFDAANAGAPTPKYYEIFDLPAEGAGKSMNLAAIFRSFPTVEASKGKVRYGVRMWTVKPDPAAPGSELVVEASQQVKMKEDWLEEFKVTFGPNRPAFTAQEDCYALREAIPAFTGIWPFLCGLEQGLTVDLTDGIIGLGQFLFKSGQLTLDAGVGIAVWEFRWMSNVWNALEGDVAARNALFQEAYVQYRTFVELGVMAGEGGSKLPMAFEKFAVQSVGAMSDFFSAVGKRDIDAVEFAVGKFLGANPDMLLEPLVVARNYQRMSKAMLKLEEELVDSSIRASMLAEDARKATSLDQRLADAVAAGKAPETALLPGDVLSDSKLLDIYGVTREQRKAVQKIAKDNEVVITFRSRNPLSVNLLKDGLAYPKPQALKHKTVNQIDIDFLGYRKDAKATLEMVEPPAGLLDPNGRALTGDTLEAAIEQELTRHSGKIGGNKVLEQEVRDRMKGRAEEWNKLFFDKLDTTQPGTINQKITTAFEADLQYVPADRDLVKQVGAVEDRIVSYEPVAGREPRTWEMKMTGPRDGIGNPGPPKAVTGDVDFLAVLDEASGLILDPQKRREVYAQLATALDMQHGESFTFFLQKARLEHLRCCALGAKNAEAMVAISGVGDGTPRAAYFVDNLSIIDNPGGKNAKYLPRRKKTPQSITDFFLRPGEAKTVRRVDPSGEFMLLDGVHITTKPPLDLVNRFVPDTLGERLTRFISSPNYVVPALLLRLFDAEDKEAVFSRDIDAVIIRALDGGEQFILQVWTEGAQRNRKGVAGGWQEITMAQALATGDPDVLELAPATILPAGAAPGQRRVEIASQAQFGTPGGYFAVGDRVVINPGGENEEFRTVQGFGSLLFASEVEFEHESGELIVSLGSDTTDRDGDNLTGFEEVALGTNPDLADSDFDGLNDDVEILNGYDPLDPRSGFTINSIVSGPPGTGLQITWNGAEGRTYAVDASRTLREEDWVEVSRVTGGPGLLQMAPVADPFPGEAKGFFRLRLVPVP